MYLEKGGDWDMVIEAIEYKEDKMIHFCAVYHDFSMTFNRAVWESYVLRDIGDAQREELLDLVNDTHTTFEYDRDGDWDKVTWKRELS